MAHNDLVQSVTRSLDILELIARAEEGLTLQEIAQGLGIAPPTAHNLARTLLARGYVEKSSRPTRYRLGAGVFDLVRAQSHRQFVQRAAAVVPPLAREIEGATVTLVEARGGELQVTLRMSPELPGLLQRPSGQMMNVYISAAGLVFQAFWTDGERARYRGRYPFDEFGAHAWRSLAHLDEAIADVRRRGYALPTSEDNDLFRVAVPIFTASHTLAASLGMSFHTTGREPACQTRAIAAVIAAAGQIASAD